MGPRKGVIAQSVKDVVQSLVDDDLVSKDKIGTSVSFIIQTDDAPFQFWYQVMCFLNNKGVSAMYSIKSTMYFNN